MLYTIRKRFGPISHLVSGYHSTSDKYQIVINGLLVEYKSRTSWSGLGTARRILRIVLHNSLLMTYGWDVFRYSSYDDRNLIVTEIMKKHAGKDPSCRIHLRKI